MPIHMTKTQLVDAQHGSVESSTGNKLFAGVAVLTATTGLMTLAYAYSKYKAKLAVKAEAKAAAEQKATALVVKEKSNRNTVGF